MTPFCQRRPDESITAWHRRIHETAHDWRDVAEFLTLRGLHHEAKMVTSVAHLKREERTVALLGVAEERMSDADRFMGRINLPENTCGQNCTWNMRGPCECRSPAELQKLLQRARALRWAAEALMRPEPSWNCSGCGAVATGSFHKDWVHVFAGEDVCRACQVEHAGDVLAQAAKGPTASTLAAAARVCLLDAREEPHEGEKRHLKRLADQMIERAGGLARSAAVVCGHNPCVFHCGEDPQAPFRSARPSSSGSPSK